MKRRKWVCKEHDTQWCRLCAEPEEAAIPRKARELCERILQPTITTEELIDLNLKARDVARELLSLLDGV